MTNFPLLIVELAFLGAAHVFGGPPWTMIGVVAILAHVAGGIGVGSILLVASSLVWLAASTTTGNRELFFPFTMHLAACAALVAARRAPWAGWLGGGAVVAVFMAIRILQQASARVLAVELLVATAILACVLTARRWSRDRPTREATVVGAAALAAYASLAL